jgi:hypothetical protein
MEGRVEPDYNVRALQVAFICITRIHRAVRRHSMPRWTVVRPIPWRTNLTAVRRLNWCRGVDRGFSSETQSLLQSRLRAAAAILLLAYCLYMLRRLFVQVPLLAFHLGLTVLLAASVVVLSRRRLFSMVQLRILELVIFGASAGFVAVAFG